MTGPVTAQIQDLFERHGLDATQHQGLVTDLMHYVWDKVEAEISAVLDGGKSCASIGCERKGNGV